MTKKIVWRLKEQPSAEMLQELVKTEIITKDEAREILFNLQDDEERNVDSLKAEITFLKEIVQKLSEKSTRIVEIIKEVEVPYYRKPWYKPYEIWCNANSGVMNAVQTAEGTELTSKQSFSQINSK